MDWGEHPILQKILLTIPALIVINIIALDIWWWYNLKHSRNIDKEIVSLISAKNKPAPTTLPTIVPTPHATPTIVASRGPIVSSSVKEFYIPIGSNSFYSEGVWGDVPGAEVTVDSKNYGQIRNVTFEASVHVANAMEDVAVRLYNKTDDHPVWFSDLFFPSGTTTNFLSSPTITLDGGKKVYKVQMKTQFRVYANLDQSRIHITIQ